MKHVDLVERSILDDTIDALQMEDWKTDMDRDMLSIDQILPNTSAGDDSDDVGGKALAIECGFHQFYAKSFATKHSITAY